MKEKLGRFNWKVNSIIRNKVSGHPYLVTYSSKYGCTLVDLTSNEALPIAVVLLPRKFEEYAIDEEMNMEKKKEEIEWEYNPQLAI